MYKKIHRFACLVSTTTRTHTHTSVRAHARAQAKPEVRSSSQRCGEGSTQGRCALLGHPEQCD